MVRISNDGTGVGFIASEDFLLDPASIAEDVEVNGIAVWLKEVLQAEFDSLQLGVSKLSFESGVLYPVQIAAEELTDLGDAFLLDVVHENDVHGSVPRGYHQARRA
jgi:hypothetical protein